MYNRPRLVLLSTACGSLLMTACGPTSTEASFDTRSASGSGDEVATATAPSGPHRLELQIGPDSYMLDTHSARYTRLPVYGVDGVEAVELEVLDADNTVFAKADLFVAVGAPLEGVYGLGLRGQEGIVNVPGQGQVITAIEETDGRSMRVSGDGKLTLKREGDFLLASFEYRLNGFNAEPLDQPVRGSLRIRKDLTELR